ncbi:MAG: FAD-dependent oxidoreductase [Hyphomicrobiaceae bacterium]
MSARFLHLFSEIEIGNCVVANRIVSTGHHTYLSNDVPDERLIAYHEARAKGGAGLIVSEIVAVHETAGFSQNLLKATSRDAIPAYARLADACHTHGTRIFAQLFHPGREILSAWGGMLPVAWAPSAVPNERFHIMPKPMPADLIEEIIEGFGRTAGLLTEAGFDGFEIVGSHGYLPAQFLNPRVNLRDDDYGGDAARRLRFLKDAVASIRSNAEDRVVGVRLSGAEMDSGGLTETEILDVCAAIGADVDYLSVVAGTSASLGGSVHISPPMGIPHGYIAPFSSAIRKASGVPVIATGRINQPQVAEQLIESGQADLCGMTRAMICDAAMAGKAREGRADDIRACIGCNQACIGRAHKGLGISCIQHPESGRELEFGSYTRAAEQKRIIVAGGGPAGMKAASVAAARGHRVELYEKDSGLGGQALLAQRLPGRDEFGGIVINLEREVENAGVKVRRNTPVTRALVDAETPDAVVLATGALPYEPVIEGGEQGHVVTAWDVLLDRANVGASVVVADWRADWIGLGLAERLAAAGCSVTLCTNAALAGETLQIYTRNHYVGRLHKLGVTIRTHARLFGVDEDTAYFQDTLSDEAILIEGTDTLVLSLGHHARNELENELAGVDCDVHVIGDCLTPRTAEEAVYEGLLVGTKI